MLVGELGGVQNSFLETRKRITKGGLATTQAHDQQRHHANSIFLRPHNHSRVLISILAMEDDRSYFMCIHCLSEGTHIRMDQVLITLT